MTRPPKFRIDLTEQFPTLQNAPIVEAVIQFNAPPRMVIEPGALRKVLEENCDGYLISDQVQFEAGLTGSPGLLPSRYRLAVSAELRPAPAPVTDERRILQFGKEYGSSEGKFHFNTSQRFSAATSPSNRTVSTVAFGEANVRMLLLSL